MRHYINTCHVYNRKTGPEHERYFPSYRDGCCYGREEDCCWVCCLRLIRSASEPAVEEAKRAARSRATIGIEHGDPSSDRAGAEPLDRRRGDAADTTVSVELGAEEDIERDVQSLRP